MRPSAKRYSRGNQSLHIFYSPNKEIMKYILSVPLRFIGLSLMILILWTLIAIGSIILITWHFEFKWYYVVKEYFWGSDYYFLIIDTGSKPYCYKTFWDAVFNRKT